MNASSKIYVAGHQGLVGSALVRRLTAIGCGKIIVRTRQELDLTEQSAVREFFDREQPEYVFLAAAKVGGILANATLPADFIYQNLLIQTHVLDAAYRSGVKRLLFLGSSCIYPKHAPQPIREQDFLTGPLEPTNQPYAVAKISGVEMCWSYNRQYGTRFVAAMPTNLYGPRDRYDLKASHVIPALIRKMHEACAAGADNVVIWGSGKPRREFLYSEDAADACIFLIKLPDKQIDTFLQENGRPILNIGCGEDISIHDLAQLIAEVTGFKNRLVFDGTKPDGTPQKLLDISRMTALGWRAQTSLRAGLAKTFSDFLERYRTGFPADQVSA